MKKILLSLAASAAALATSQAATSLFISEVMSSEGAGQTYNADWFELTNPGSTAISLAGWKIDDDSNSFASGALLTGPTSIAAGQSIVFVEGTATTQTNFINSWFGGTAPAGFTIGSYSGSGLGFGSGGDQVNVFDSAGVRQANVLFSTATAGRSFDNAAGINGSISTLSTAGTNGAFAAPSPSTEVGSPGVVPEPSAAAMIVAGIGVFLACQRRRFVLPSQSK